MEHTLNPNRIGLAAAGTAGLLYIACVLFIVLAGKEVYVPFFNSLFHGIDIAPIARASISFGQTIMGLIITLIGMWLIGMIFAWLYNWQQK
ncbi:hypothetical protein HYS48_04315 [Candidatus Woesearchaeota archaeon]|nr:hypothetical protein [Candidatus Woesearchaeota archaeon]